MRRRICGWMLLTTLVLSTGCSTFRAYPGEQRPRGEVATIEVPRTDRLIVNRRLAQAEHITTVEVLPGEQTVEWRFVYPNKYSEMKRITFTADAGRHYRLGQRFVPAPYEGNPLEFMFDVAIDTTVTPFMMIFPPESPKSAPEGEYYMWVKDENSEKVLAGTAPDVPAADSAVTLAPPEASDENGAPAARRDSAPPESAP